jgi:choice-of-anchor C domain-containing protein
MTLAVSNEIHFLTVFGVSTRSLSKQIKFMVANLIINGSFEDGIQQPAPNNWLPLNPNSTAIDGWIVTRGQIDYKQTYWENADGLFSLDLNGSPGVGGIAQTFYTVPGQQYRVSFALSGHPDGGNDVKQLGVSAAGQTARFYFDTTGFSRSYMGWRDETWVFTANAATTTLEIYSLSYSSSDGYYGPAIDNVSVVDLSYSDNLLNASVYRFYNPRSRGHFFTTNEGERDTLLNNPQWGYIYENEGFKASEIPGPYETPIYRFYNPKSQGHFFTASEAEKNTVLANPQWGYQFENVGFYAYGSQVAGSVPVYRFYNPFSQGHFFTINEAEKNTVLANPQWGYSFEGVGFYANV